MGLDVLRRQARRSHRRVSLSGECVPVVLQRAPEPYRRCALRMRRLHHPLRLVDRRHGGRRPRLRESPVRKTHVADAHGPSDVSRGGAVPEGVRSFRMPPHILDGRRHPRVSAHVRPVEGDRSLHRRSLPLGHGVLQDGARVHAEGGAEGSLLLFIGDRGNGFGEVQAERDRGRGFDGFGRGIGQAVAADEAAHSREGRSVRGEVGQEDGIPSCGQHVPLLLPLHHRFVCSVHAGGGGLLLETHRERDAGVHGVCFRGRLQDVYETEPGVQCRRDMVGRRSRDEVVCGDRRRRLRHRRSGRAGTVRRVQVHEISGDHRCPGRSDEGIPSRAVQGAQIRPVLRRRLLGEGRRGVGEGSGDPRVHGRPVFREAMRSRRLPIQGLLSGTL